MDQAKIKYDSGENPFNEILAVNNHCLQILQSCNFSYRANSDGKEYWVFSNNGSDSRPICKSKMLEKTEFDKYFTQFQTYRINDYSIGTISCSELNNLLYTAISNFCACYDIFKRGSRKTPGTYFEILLGTFISHILFDYERKKFIKLPEYVSDSGDSSEADEDSVSTDIVFEKAGYLRFVFPAKITTRERVVQPFAHQRIIDSAFGERQYLSFLLCVSEMQLDKDNSVHPVCVPGTIKLFQRHLAKVGGIFYLDPPQRYLDEDVSSFITVETIGNLLGNIIKDYIKPIQASANKGISS